MLLNFDVCYVCVCMCVWVDRRLEDVNAMLDGVRLAKGWARGSSENVRNRAEAEGGQKGNDIE